MLETRIATEERARAALAARVPAKATNGEIDAETDDTKFTTVAKVFRAIARKVRPASTTVAGIAEIATQAEGDAGTDATRVMTPALVKRRVDAEATARIAADTALGVRITDVGRDFILDPNEWVRTGDARTLILHLNPASIPAGVTHIGLTFRGARVPNIALVANQSNYTVSISAINAGNILRNLGTATVVPVEVEYIATRSIVARHTFLIPVVATATATGGGTDDQTAAEVSVDASGFDGNLAATDNNVQKVAQKVDDLQASGGGGNRLVADENTVIDTEITITAIAFDYGDILTATFTPTGTDKRYLIEANGEVDLEYSTDDQRSSNQMFFRLRGGSPDVTLDASSMEIRQKEDDRTKYAFVSRSIWTPGVTTERTVRLQGTKGSSRTRAKVKNVWLTVTELA